MVLHVPAKEWDEDRNNGTQCALLGRRNWSAPTVPLILNLRSRCLLGFGLLADSGRKTLDQRDFLSPEAMGTREPRM